MAARWTPVGLKAVGGIAQGESSDGGCAGQTTKPRSVFRYSSIKDSASTTSVELRQTGKNIGDSCSASGPECVTGCCFERVCSPNAVCFGDSGNSGKSLGDLCSASGPECASGCCLNAACAEYHACFGYGSSTSSPPSSSSSGPDGWYLPDGTYYNPEFPEWAYCETGRNDDCASHCW
jgi:hypothetical protein